MVPTVSIIVPIYNAEKYLPRCIESILNQTYKNIELILINDGSRDQSGQICDLFAKRDARIIVVHKENSGVSDARNEGIKLSTGEYLQFVDSDDYLDYNMTEMLLDAVQRDESDIVFCGYKVINYKTGKSLSISYSHSETSFDFKGFLAIYADLNLKAYSNAPWNKIFKAYLIKKHQIFFNSELDLGEDLLFNIEAIKKCNRFSVISLCLYNYIQYDAGENLAGKYRKNMYAIQKMIFEQVISLYSDPNNYSVQIFNLEQIYTRILFYLVLNIASHTNLKDFQSYKQMVSIVRRDGVLERRINSIKIPSSQERLLAFLIRHNMYVSIFTYAKIRIFIRNRLPLVFEFLKKVGGIHE